MVPSLSSLLSTPQYMCYWFWHLAFILINVQIMAVLLESEKRYVSALTLLNSHYRQPMHILASFKPEILSMQQLNTLFLNWCVDCNFSWVAQHPVPRLVCRLNSRLFWRFLGSRILSPKCCGYNKSKHFRGSAVASVHIHRF